MPGTRIEPYDVGRLEVGDGHALYYEQVGNPDGIPVVFLHGGPGSGLPPGAPPALDASRIRAVRFDQRAAGRSTPHASREDVHWDSIDMSHHVADIEALRTTLGIERWAVYGTSWGSVLGLTYAQRHPERITAVVVAAVSTGSQADIDWLTVGAGRFFPEAWQEFYAHVPAELASARLVDAYNTLLMDSDPDVHHAAATAWCRWEEALVGSTQHPAWSNPRYADPAFRLGFARQVTHCFRHDSWLEAGEMLSRMQRLQGAPGTLVHGLLDLSSPPDDAWHLHQAWPGSVLHLVNGEGHGGDTMHELSWTAVNQL